MIVVRFKRTFPLRVCEWFCACVMLTWGFTVLLYPVSFTLAPFAVLRAFAAAPIWAGLALAIGSMRFAALTINGAWRNSPHLRVIGAFLAILLWWGLSLGLMQSAVPSTGLAVYPWFVILDGYNVYRAARDARASDENTAKGLVGHH